MVPGFVILPAADLDDPATHAAVADALGAFGGEAFGVRSSATAEDLEQASFAGVYDSYLNVRGVEAVIARARGVSVDLDGQAMAVLVQPLLAAEAAGVAFTRDPVSGASRVVIDAAFGLGEGRRRRQR